MKAEEIFLTVICSLVAAPFVYEATKFFFQTIAGVVVLIAEAGMVAARVSIDFIGGAYRKLLTRFENCGKLEEDIEVSSDDEQPVELDLLEDGKKSKSVPVTAKRRPRRRRK
jgi:hypothetical protein